MKAVSATPLTAVLAAALLAGAGICISLRHAADRQRRAMASSAKAGATMDPVEVKRDRKSAASGMEAFQPGDRAALRERLSKVWASGDDLDRSRGLLETMDRLAAADFPAFFDELSAVTDGNYPMLEMAFAAWAEVDPEAALQRETEMTGMGSTPSAVLKVWAARDPIAALDWLTSHNSRGADEVLQALAAEDPAAALAWAKEHDDPASIRGVAHHQLVAALQGMMTARLADAIRSFSGLPEDIRKSVLAGVSSRAGSLDETGRRQWLKGLRGDDERNIAAAAMIGAMDRLDSLKEPLELLNEYPGAVEKPGAESLFVKWVKEDRDAALEAVEKLPEGAVRNAALNSALQGLEEGGDPKKALELINLNPQAVDEMTMRLWFDMAASDAHEWELAISQLPRVNDEVFREDAYREIMTSWLFTDRDAARAWLDSHDDVPENVRKALELR